MEINMITYTLWDSITDDIGLPAESEQTPEVKLLIRDYVFGKMLAYMAEKGHKVC